MKAVSPEAVATRAWPIAVGKIIAAHSNVAAVVDKKLVIDVEDFEWQRQLFTLRRQILARMEQVAGTGLFIDLQFRIALPRRMPQREENAAAAPVQDEADGIRDRSLRYAYKMARKRASA
ncbi:MAG: DUF721 domain-containing protein [Bryobacteraceae bacterium]|nr:DUF721 domain-containing protein [Bryobacterales bacterium]MEB2361981.1 DciA family protein [Bryobacterales bacterium]NUN01647.1 DUF721 domain-containing protein [Bryobacteraceae bacterium]